LVPGWKAPEWRADITRELELFVTAERFAYDLPAADAQVLVTAHVNKLLTALEDQRLAEEERKRKELGREALQERRELLLKHGRAYLRGKTQFWEPIDQAHAARALEEEMEKELKLNLSHLTWTLRYVEILADEVIRWFEDEDDEDYDEPDDDDGSEPE
jgi:hypothetical protein